MIEKAAISIDLEDWFHGILSYNNSLEKQRSLENRFVKSTECLLKIFSEAGIRGTFFILASLAIKEPKLILEIKAEGHEIASHGWSHQLIYKLTPKEFEEDIKRSKEALEDITAEPVIGYRAPYFSITEECQWAMPIIEKTGFLYDSSISPFKNFVYGIQGANRFYHRVSEKLVELPTSCLNILNRPIPWAGGFYFRIMPYSLIKYGLKKIYKNNNGIIVYLHTADFDLEQPKKGISHLERFIHFAGIRTLPGKLNKLFSDFSLNPIREVYKSVIWES